MKPRDDGGFGGRDDLEATRKYRDGGRDRSPSYGMVFDLREDRGSYRKRDHDERRSRRRSRSRSPREWREQKRSRDGDHGRNENRARDYGRDHSRDRLH